MNDSQKKTNPIPKENTSNSKIDYSNANKNRNNRGYNKSKFMGREPKLNGFVFDTVSSMNCDEFLRTKKELGLVLASKY